MSSLNVPSNPIRCVFCQQYLINQVLVDECADCNASYLVNSKNYIRDIFININYSCRVKFCTYNQTAELQIRSNSIYNNQFHKVFNFDFDFLYGSVQNIRDKANSLLLFL